MTHMVMNLHKDPPGKWLVDHQFGSLIKIFMPIKATAFSMEHVMPLMTLATSVVCAETLTPQGRQLLCLALRASQATMTAEISTMRLDIGDIQAWAIRVTCVSRLDIRKEKQPHCTDVSKHMLPWQTCYGESRG